MATPTQQPEAFRSGSKWGWRLRLSSGIEITRSAAFPTPEAALANAAADTRALMTGLGIVEAKPATSYLYDLDLGSDPGGAF